MNGRGAEGDSGAEPVPPSRGDEGRSAPSEPRQHFTQPPPRYSEAQLVKTMEELGIGRPSTYAPTIETIQKRGYVVLRDRRFHPTELGRLVTELLERFFPEIIDVSFTAKMEADLDRIEAGALDSRTLLETFYAQFQRRLEAAEAEMAPVTLAPPRERLSTTRTARLTPLRSRFRRGKRPRSAAVPGGISERTSPPPSRISSYSRRCASGVGTSTPEARTAIVRPPARRADRCAAASMPKAMPLTTAAPSETKSLAKRSARRRP
ncbi:MAG: hypothetical protein KM296_06755 [Brockia lithotrophica]|nr:hypothetical protein [Brockia lithotrophica]